jgi:hypothetical protein
MTKEELWEEQMTADIENKRADTDYKRTMLRWEPWKAILAAVAATAALAGFTGYKIGTVTPPTPPIIINIPALPKS